VRIQDIMRTLLLIFFAVGSLLARDRDLLADAAAIDAILAADWKEHKLSGNPMSDDATFVRRIYLDVIGRIPTMRETAEFISDKSPDRRAKLISRLLSSEAHVQHAFHYWADVLRLLTNGAIGVSYADYVKDSLRTNKPYDQFVAGLISAQGRPWENGAIGYYLRDQGMPLDNMASTVRIFLGTRIECAQCHNHPFDKWTQMQFYQMAGNTYGVQGQNYGGVIGDARRLHGKMQDALRAENRASHPEPKRPKRTKDMTPEQFAKLEAEFNEKMALVQASRREFDKQIGVENRFFQNALLDANNYVRDTALGFDEKRRPTLPRDYQYPDAKPRSAVESNTLFGHPAAARPGETPLQAYARWMTSKENPRFTTVIVNRLWKRAFGLALIEPLDELMDNSAPMIPALQTHLEKLMRDLDFDTRDFLTVIYNTQAYQRQVTREDVPSGVTYHFTGPLLRRMSAEQLWDSLVTLINPDPDMPNTAARELMDQQVLQAKKSVDAMNTMKPEEALTVMQKAAGFYRSQRDVILKLQDGIAEATRRRQQLEAEAKKATGDDVAPAKAAAAEARKEADRLRREFNASTRQAREIVQGELILPAQLRLYEKVTGKPHASIASASSTSGNGGGSGSGSTMTMAASSSGSQAVRIPGYDPVPLTSEEKKAADQQRYAAYAKEADYYGIPEKERTNYYRTRDEQRRNYLRAAELPSPAPRGHYLREFGQSDRETIENANYDASVPQVLALMNGTLLPNITNGYSQLMLAVRKAPYPDDKLDAVYLTLLSRPPTARERTLWTETQGKGLDSIEDLVFSLLNTQQFIFVQ
jgi:hypothetical protein